MSEPISAADQAVLQRRGFLRSGALLAAAAGGAVVATAGVAAPASAATGDAIEVGGSFDGTTTTTLALDPGSATAAALTLTNPSGPALQLTPLTDFTGELPVGGIAATPAGLLVGLQPPFSSTPVTAGVVTTADLQGLPVSIPFPAGRVLNTKDEATYDTIVATSPGAFDSQHRLKKGAWVDVALLPDQESFQVGAAFLTLTALGSTSAGSLVSCPPGPQPPKVATLPFDKGRTVATGTYVETGVVAKSAAVRIYASATTHLKVDVTGVTIFVDFDPDAGTPAPNVAGLTRAAQAKIAKHVQQVGARARLA